MIPSRCILLGLVVLVWITLSFDSVSAARGQTQSGVCSYYTGGGTTASGEPYNENALTAAHPTWPFNTMVRVYNDQGKSVVLRINDRGPFVAGRILDMSKRAAQELGIITSGLVKNCKIVWL